MGGGQFENLIFGNFCQEGGNQNVLIFYSILSGFLKGIFKGNHPLIFPKNAPQNNAKSLYLEPFWVYFSTLLRNALDFQWYPMVLEILKFGYIMI